MSRYSVASVIIILIIWFVLYQLNFINTALVPSPLTVGQKLFNFLLTKNTMIDLWMTFIRVLIGFIGIIIIGVPFGIILGYYKKIYEFFEIPIDFFRSLPAPAIFPLFMLLFGIGDKAKLILVIFSGSLIASIYTAYGVRNCKKIKIMAGKSLGLDKRSLFFEVILREALPEIVSGLRVSLSITVILVIVLEMFTGSKLGLGKQIYEQFLMFRIAKMYSVIIITGFLGYFLNKGFVFLERRFVHWAGR